MYIQTHTTTRCELLLRAVIKSIWKFSLTLSTWHEILRSINKTLTIFLCICTWPIIYEKLSLTKIRISLLSFWKMITGSFMWIHLFFTARTIIRSNKHSKVMCQCHIAHRKTKQIEKCKSPDSFVIISCKINILYLAQWYYAPAELHQCKRYQGFCHSKIKLR